MGEGGEECGGDGDRDEKSSSGCLDCGGGCWFHGGVGWLLVCQRVWVRVARVRALYGHLDYEIVIADDGTPDPVKAPGCVVVSLPKKEVGLNPCVPLNAAVRASSGDVIVLTNPEVEHREDVLTGMLAMLEHPDDYVTVACRDTSGMWIAGPEVNYAFENGRLPVPPGAHFHFCAMFRRELFDRVGGFANVIQWSSARPTACFRAKQPSESAGGRPRTARLDNGTRRKLGGDSCCLGH